MREICSRCGDGIRCGVGYSCPECERPGVSLLYGEAGKELILSIEEQIRRYEEMRCLAVGMINVQNNFGALRGSRSRPPNAAQEI